MRMVAGLCLFLALAGSAWAEDVWVGAWASAQQIPEPQNALSDEDLHDATLRQTIHPAVGGSHFRLRLSNAFGTEPFKIDTVLAGTAKVTFSGHTDGTIPAGADYLSDEFALDLPDNQSLTVSMHIPEPPARQTGHPGSRSTSYLGQKPVEHWYFLSGLEVKKPVGSFAVVAFGDSITDGHGATVDGDDRWTDVLARRGIDMLNLGIGGNHLLTDGLGPNALARFDRDVLARPGVKAVIVLEGINDLGNLTRLQTATPEQHAAKVKAMTEAYAQIIERAHSAGLRIIGGTLLPYGGSGFYHPDAANEADRQAVNRWIRAAGHFDAVIDFDAVMRDPKDSFRMRPDYDSGDHLHPSPAGYRAMGEAIPLALLDPAPELAITIDDLPVHNDLPPGMSRLDVAKSIIASLQEAGVPQPYGFVNAAPIAKDGSLQAVLDVWRAAGFPLGNHTWSHANLDQLTVADFESEITRNEPAIQGGDWRWFRYPFLVEGKDPKKRAEIRRFLKERNYRIAAVTMTFGDYEWNGPYARCMAKHDDAAIAELEASYLAEAREAVDLSRKASPNSPYVLLMHIGAFDARMLPKLLAQYKAEGFRFVTLPEAERNYDDAVTPPLPSPQVDTARLAALCLN
jgi:lysophospholipase L1-like esterase